MSFTDTNYYFFLYKHRNFNTEAKYFNSFSFREA